MGTGQESDVGIVKFALMTGMLRMQSWPHKAQRKLYGMKPSIYRPNCWKSTIRIIPGRLEYTTDAAFIGEVSATTTRQY